MKKFGTIIFTFCGLLMLAAFPVFGQNDKSVREIQINKEPINEFAQYLIAKIENEKTDLTQPFKVVLEGTLIRKTGNDGDIVVLDTGKSRWIALPNEETGDPQVGEIAKNAIVAISDSGFFGYLYNLEVKDFKITFYQNADKFAVNFESEMESVERARTTASGLNMIFQVAQTVIKKEDEKFLLRGFKTPTTNDKTLLLNFELPKNTVHEMINRNLANYKNRNLSGQK